MARHFRGTGYSDQLNCLSTPVTATAVTLAGWFWPQFVGSSPEDYLILAAHNQLTGSGFYLYVATSSTAVTVKATAVGISTGTATITTTLDYSAAPVHVAAVFSGGTNRRAYLNGAGGASNLVSATPSGVSAVCVGADVRTSLNRANGYLGELAVWNAALGTDDIASLYKGASPLLVKPTSLRSYWPLYGNDSPEPDWRDDYSLTVVDSPQVRHFGTRYLRPVVNRNKYVRDNSVPGGFAAGISLAAAPGAKTNSAARAAASLAALSQPRPAAAQAARGVLTAGTTDVRVVDGGLHAPAVAEVLPYPGSVEFWQNPSGALTQGDLAEATLEHLGAEGLRQSDLLVVRDFDLQVPANASVLGVQVELYKWYDENTEDVVVRLVSGGELVGDNFPATFGYYDGWATHGGPGVLWGHAWTPSLVNDPSFGVGLVVRGNQWGSMLARIDGARLKVVYAMPGVEMRGALLASSSSALLLESPGPGLGAAAALRQSACAATLEASDTAGGLALRAGLLSALLQADALAAATRMRSGRSDLSSEAALACWAELVAANPAGVVASLLVGLAASGVTARDLALAAGLAAGCEASAARCRGGSLAATLPGLATSRAEALRGAGAHFPLGLDALADARRLAASASGWQILLALDAVAGRLLASGSPAAASLTASSAGRRDAAAAQQSVLAAALAGAGRLLASGGAGLSVDVGTLAGAARSLAGSYAAAPDVTLAAAARRQLAGEVDALAAAVALCAGLRLLAGVLDADAGLSQEARALSSRAATLGVDVTLGLSPRGIQNAVARLEAAADVLLGADPDTRRFRARYLQKVEFPFTF